MKKKTILSVLAALMVAAVLMAVPAARNSQAATVYGNNLFAAGDFDAFSDYNALQGNAWGNARMYNSWFQPNANHVKTVFTDDPLNPGNRVMKLAKDSADLSVDKAFNSAVTWVRAGVDAGQTATVTFDIYMPQVTSATDSAFISIYYKWDVFSTINAGAYLALPDSSTTPGYKTATLTTAAEPDLLYAIEIFACTDHKYDIYIDNFSAKSAANVQIVEAGDFEQVFLTYPVITGAADDLYGHMWWGQGFSAASIVNFNGDGAMKFQSKNMPFYAAGWADNAAVVNAAFVNFFEELFDAGTYEISGDIKAANDVSGTFSGVNAFYFFESGAAFFTGNDMLANYSTLPDSGKAGFKKFSYNTTLTQAEAESLKSLTLKFEPGADKNNYIIIDNFQVRKVLGSTPVLTVTDTGAVDLKTTDKFNLEYSAGGAPAPECEATCDRSTGYTLDGKEVTFTEAGTYVFTITAENIHGEDIKTITITVTDTRVAPGITATGTGAIDLKDGSVYTLVYSVSGDPVPDVTVTCDKTSGFTRTDKSVTFTATGTYIFTVSATNAKGTDTKTITVTVTDTTPQGGGGCSCSGIAVAMTGLGLAILLLKKKH